VRFAAKKKTYTVLGRKVKKSNIVLTFVIIAIGWFIHIALDCALKSNSKLSLIPGIPLDFCPKPFSDLSLLAFDAFILLAWLFWEQHKHRIIDYV